MKFSRSTITSAALILVSIFSFIYFQIQSAVIDNLENLNESYKEEAIHMAELANEQEKLHLDCFATTKELQIEMEMLREELENCK